MRRGVLLALLLLLPAPLLAQSGSARDTVTRAVRAYEDLDFDLAATLLRRALASALDDSTRVRALAYLGAAEHYRMQPDSAAAAFHQLALLAPGYQPDTLVFAPEVTTLYN
ncbi:MAG TPA: hypothetical protein VGU74_01750, partial [Gemmatimonadales bacterium]|nr:hypothetical protein [Gemmatimonadales bacterium]